MGRKSKQPGGHNPLTYHEAKRLTYGTEKTRLGTDSQRKFGYCCLSLEPAKDPVVTPSGHMYSREAIVTYLLAKTKELKERQASIETKIAERELRQNQSEQDSLKQQHVKFLEKDQGALQHSKSAHAKAFLTHMKKEICIDSKGEKLKQLAKTSYWLADFNPEVTEDSMALSKYVNSKESAEKMRPASPMTGEPLRLKDLVPIRLQREDASASPDSVRFVCSVSGKLITTQPAVAIRKSGVVMLTSLFENLVKEELASSKKRKREEGDGGAASSSTSLTLICPLTGQKFKEKDIIHLQKASTGFAASGNVEAKKYVPTLT